MAIFKKVKTVKVPETVAVCPECGARVIIDDDDGDDVIVGCEVRTGHNYHQGDWEPIRNLINSWVHENVRIIETNGN